MAATLGPAFLFTLSGTTNNLSTGTGNAINITNQTGTHTVAFSGPLNIDTSTGTGVNLGTTFNFTGDSNTIDATGAGSGFIATGGGTVTLTGSGNYIATVGGTALNISNTTIGASGITFHDINANGGTNGIVLMAPARAHSLLRATGRRRPACSTATARAAPSRTPRMMPCC